MITNKNITYFFISTGTKIAIKDYLFFDTKTRTNKFIDDDAALIKAASLGHLKIVEHLVDTAEPSVKELYKAWGALADRSWRTTYDILKTVVGYDMSVNTRNVDGCTPLMEAAALGRVDIVEYLTDAGANVNAIDNYGYTALHKACSNGHWAVAEYLTTKCHAKLNIQSFQNGYTGLILAATHGHLGVVKCLVEHNANIHIKSDSKYTAFMYACRHGNTQIVKYLLKHEININQKDSCGNTPLILAVQSGNMDIVLSLLDNDAKMNLRNSLGESALDLALDSKYTSLTREQQIDLAEHLIQYGVDVNAVDRFGRTTLMKVVSAYPSTCNINAVKLLVDNGADVGMQDCTGRTVLDMAHDALNVSSLVYLKKAGAQYSKGYHYDGDYDVNYAIQKMTKDAVPDLTPKMLVSVHPVVMKKLRYADVGKKSFCTFVKPILDHDGHAMSLCRSFDKIVYKKSLLTLGVAVVGFATYKFGETFEPMKHIDKEEDLLGNFDIYSDW